MAAVETEYGAVRTWRDFSRITEMYDSVVVTGPQRSGTTICAKMIARDTGLEFVDEAVSVYTVLSGVRTCTQAPQLSDRVEELSGPRRLIVWMLRPWQESVASEERIGWSFASEEIARYRRFGYGEGDLADGIAALKQRHWLKQRGLVEHYWEVRYADLEGHPLWVTAERRKHFAPKQTA